MAFARPKNSPGSYQNVGPGTTRQGLSFGAGGTLPSALNVQPSRAGINQLGNLAQNYSQGPMATALANADALNARRRMDAAATAAPRGLRQALSEGAGPGIELAGQGMQDAFRTDQAVRGGEAGMLGTLFGKASAFEDAQRSNVQRLATLRDLLYQRDKGRFDAWLNKKQSDALAAAARPRRQKFLGIF